MRKKLKNDWQKIRHKKLWPRIGIAILVILFLIALVSISYLVKTSKPKVPPEEVLGISAVAWPNDNDWIFLTRNGQVVTDREARGGCNDITHGAATPSQENDISSQADCKGGGTHYNPGYIDDQFGTGQQPGATPQNTYSGAVAYRDTNNDSDNCLNIDDDYLFFRIRLGADPQAKNKDYLKNNVWFATFDTDSDGNIDFYIRLIGSGNHSNNDNLAVIHEESGSPNQVDPGDHVVYTYTDPLGSNHVTRIETPDNATVGDTTEYFLDFQIPFEYLQDSSGTQLMCQGNFVTLVNYSTSDNGNDVFKKDKMGDGPSDPIIFSNPEYKIEKTFEDVNGGELVAGDEVEYTLTVSNLATTMTNIEIRDDFPAGTTFIEDSYDTGKGIQVEINGTTYNLTNTNDSEGAEEPTCGADPLVCNIKAMYSTSGNGRIYFNNTNIYTTGAIAPLYDQIIIRYRVSFDQAGTYTNQAQGTTDQLPDKQFSDDPDPNNDYVNADCTAPNSYNCNNGIDDDDDPTDVTVSDNNPALVDSCGLDIALVLDSSEGIGASELQDLKDAANGFVDDLIGTATQFTVIDFDTEIVSVLPLTNDIDDIHNAVNSIGHDGSDELTNWEAAITEAQNQLDLGSSAKQNLIIMITAGDPTTYGYPNSQGSYGGTEPDAQDIDRAIQAADLAKSDGTRILAIGVGGAPDTNNLIAISGPDVDTTDLGVDVITTDFDDLLDDLIDYAARLCGGTISVNKYIGSVDQDNRAGSGWEFDVAGETVETDSNGQTEAVAVADGTYSVTETGLLPGFGFDSASCKKQGDVTVGNSTTDGVEDVPVSSEDIVTCDFVNATLDSDVEISKTDHKATAVPGTSHTYTITVSNNGPGSINGATVTDSMPSELSNVSWTCSASAGSSCTASGTGNINDTNVDLLTGGTATYTVTSDINTDATGTLTNTATVALPAGSTDSDPSNNTDTDNTVLTPQTDLTITKNDSPDPAVAGTNLTYNITVTNDGPSDATDVSLTDNLPSGLVFVGATPSQGTCDATVACDLGDLDVGDSATIQIAASINSSVSPGTVIANTAVVDGNENDPDQQNNSDTENTEITARADLQISKTDNNATAVPGDNNTYTIVITNDGPSDVVGATVTDNFPSNFKNMSWTCTSTGGSSCTPSGTGDISDTVNIVDGGTLTYTVNGDIDSGALGTLSNTATVTVPQNVTDPDTGNNSDTDSTVLEPSADVEVTKVDSPDPVTAGSTLSYTISVTNDGPSDAANVNIEDQLPTEVTFNTATPTQGSCTHTSGTVECALGTVAAGNTVNILLNVTVNSDTVPGTITNTATAESTTYDPDLTNNTGATSTETTAVATDADLSITKTDSPDPITAGENLTYTLTVANDGPAESQNVVITDQLPANTIYNDALSDSRCDETSPGIITCDLGNIGPDTEKEVDIVVVPMTDGETTGTIMITNTATVNSSTTDFNTENNSTSENTNITSSADLEMTKTASPNPVFAGNNLTYTLTVTNNGPSATSDIIITDVLPTGTQFISATPDSGNCSHNSGTITCDGFDILNRDDATQVIIIVKVPSSTASGIYVNNAASVSSDEVDDPDAQNNADSTETEVSRSTDLSVTKVDQEDPVIAGGNIAYIVTVTNNGPSDASGVTIEDTLPTETDFISATPDQGSCSESIPGTVSCELGDIAVGASVDVEITAQVLAETENELTITNQVTVDGDQDDPSGGNNSAEETTTVQTSADISVTKNDTPDPVIAGNNLTYVISVTNNGPSDSKSVTMTDPLPSEVDYISATPDQGSCSENSGTISCDLGDIANGDTVNTIVVVSVPSSTNNGSEIVNTATANSAITDDPDSSNNDGQSSTNTTQVETKSDLSITKTDSKDPVYAGEEFTYRLIVGNEGPSDASGVLVTDVLPGSVNYVDSVSGQGSCIESLGVVSCDLGTIESNENVTIELTVIATAEGEINNTATVSSDTSDPNNLDNTAAEDTTVEPSSDIEIAKFASPASLYLDQGNITYTVSITNNGPSLATGVEVIDTLPLDVELVSVTPSQGTCTGTSTINCYLGTMNNQSSASISILVTPIQAGNMRNTATVESEIYDPNTENNSAAGSATVNTNPGGGGGGGDPIPMPIPMPGEPEEVTLRPAAPEPVIEQKYCLRYEPDRALSFTDLDQAYELTPDPLPENIIPLVQKAINILKNSYIANILMDTEATQVSDIFAFDGRQYVVSGYAQRNTDGSPVTSGTTAYIGLSNTMNRLEMAKVFMISHCYPVLNSLELTTRHDSSELIHVWDDLPNIDYGDDIMNYARDVAYSAQYWWIWDGFWNAEEQRFDRVGTSENVNIAQGIKMNDRLGQLVRGETNFIRDAREGSWWNTYYAHATLELGDALSPRILDRTRAEDPLSRGEAAYELINVMIDRELYSPDELQTIVDTYTTEHDEGLLSLLGLAR